MHTSGYQQYLQPGRYIDSDHPAVIEYANNIIKDIGGATAQAVALYYTIRDQFQYNPYKIDLRPEALKASALLQRNHGYCIEKASLLAACARVAGIPSRLGFANVRNHIGTEALEKMLKTDVLVFHGYTELFLSGKWVKATPAFNIELCKKLDVKPLPFDGSTDSIFQEFDAEGGRFMEYLQDYGHFPDVPREKFIEELQRFYPHIFENTGRDGDRYFYVD